MWSGDEATQRLSEELVAQARAEVAAHRRLRRWQNASTASAAVMIVPAALYLLQALRGGGLSTPLLVAMWACLAVNIAVGLRAARLARAHRCCFDPVEYAEAYWSRWRQRGGLDGRG